MGAVIPKEIETLFMISLASQKPLLVRAAFASGFIQVRLVVTGRGLGMAGVVIEKGPLAAFSDAFSGAEC